MITNKEQLHSVLLREKKQYFGSRVAYMKSLLLHERESAIWRFQKYLRQLEFYEHQKRSKFLVARLLAWGGYSCYSRKTNKLRERLGIEIWHSCFDEGLIIWHSSGILVNSKCRIGKNCQLHGNNCIGNDGKTEGVPVIGDNCNIGFGASIIGDIRLGNNVTIGAGAVVNKSFEGDNIVLAGVPAKIIRRG